MASSRTSKERYDVRSSAERQGQGDAKRKSWGDWGGMLRNAKHGKEAPSPDSDPEDGQKRPEKWSLGILNDRETEEVPGKRYTYIEYGHAEETVR